MNPLGGLHSFGAGPLGGPVPGATLPITLTSDVTGVLPIANGGTNSSTALNNGRAIISSGGAIVESATTSTELGYVSGVTSAIQTQLNNKQTLDATLTSLALLGTGSGKFAYTTGVDTWAESDITAAGRAILDDTDASAQRTTLGLGTLATQSGTFSGTSSGTNTGDQNTFSTIAVSGQSDVVADSATDTLTLAAGANITITTNAGTDTITIAATGASTPTAITVADTTDTTTYVALFEAATGDLGPKTDGGLTYNASSGTLTATAFSGPLTGNVTGNVSGTAATVTGATQASITTLANLVSVQGKTVTLTGDLIRVGAHSLTLTTSGTTDVTLPTTGTLATLAGTETLSGKTLTAPKIANAGFIADANGNELIIFTTTASAVNELTIANGATGANPTITASGETNVGLDFQAKGSGTYRLKGTSTQAAELRLYEDTDDGSNYTAFKVGTQSSDITYTLPTAAPAVSGYALTATTGGVMSWASTSGSRPFDPVYPDDIHTGTPTVKTIGASAYTVASNTRAYVMSMWTASTAMYLTFTPSGASGYDIAGTDTSAGLGYNYVAQEADDTNGFVQPAIFSMPIIMNAGDALSRSSGAGNWTATVIELSTYDSSITTICKNVVGATGYTVTAGKKLYILGVYAHAVGDVAYLQVDGTYVVGFDCANFVSARSSTNHRPTYVLNVPIVVNAEKTIETNGYDIWFWGYEKTV